jgi:TIR domain
MSTKKRSGKSKDTTSSTTANQKATRTPGKQTRKAKAETKNTRAGSASPPGRGRKTAAQPSRGVKPPVRALDFEYDVCLSFAGENRSYVTRVAAYLRTKGARVFYDLYEQTKLWGKDLYAHLDDIYRNKARFCVMFISEAYGRKLWTNHERQSAQARAFRSNQDYILPARFDATAIPGIRDTVGYIDLKNYTPTAFAKLILAKVSEAAGGSPPASTKARMPAKGATTKQTRASTPNVRTKVNSSGAWVLLGETFFHSRAVTDHTDGTIEMTLTVSNPVQEAALRAIKTERYPRNAIAYAHGNNAALVEVQSVVIGSIRGKHTCTVTLHPSHREHTIMEITVNGITPDQSAEKRARLILLNESLSTGDAGQTIFCSVCLTAVLCMRGCLKRSYRSCGLPTMQSLRNFSGSHVCKPCSR